MVASHKAGTKVTGKYGYPTPVDKHISEVNSEHFDAVICPGGYFHFDAVYSISTVKL